MKMETLTILEKLELAESNMGIRKIISKHLNSIYDLDDDNFKARNIAIKKMMRRYPIINSDVDPIMAYRRNESYYLCYLQLIRHNIDDDDYFDIAKYLMDKIPNEYSLMARFM
jgi:hypothetical protein